MEPTPELIDQLYREEVEAARRMTPEQKLMSGAELFDLVTWIGEAGIRSENPGLPEEQVLVKLRERLDLGRRLETHP